MCYFKCKLFLIVITIIGISDSADSEKSSLGLSRASLAESSESFRRTRIKRNSFLSEAELKGQLELAKVNGLKKRFKRFSCWHSCFGELYKAIEVNEDATTKTNHSFVESNDSPEINTRGMRKQKPTGDRRKEQGAKEYDYYNPDQQDEDDMEMPNTQYSGSKEQPDKLPSITSTDDELPIGYDYYNPGANLQSIKETQPGKLPSSTSIDELPIGHDYYNPGADQQPSKETKPGQLPSSSSKDELPIGHDYYNPGADQQPSKDTQPGKLPSITSKDDELPIGYDYYNPGANKNTDKN